MNPLIKMTIVAGLMVAACVDKKQSQQSPTDRWKEEILQTEKDFAEMAKEEGIAKAFRAFAAEDAVLMRDNKLVIGKSNLIDYFENQQSLDKISLSWKPDFVDVSLAGDLGYTYGSYAVSFTDSIGVERESSGIFHTVWKRQTDDTWKFVWD